MRAEKIRELEERQTRVARKVLDKVSVIGWTTVASIMSQMATAGHRIDRHVVEGCIGCLKDDGLVREGVGANRGAYQRVSGRLETVETTSEAPAALAKAAPVPAPAQAGEGGACAKLLAVATSLRNAAQQIDEAVLEIELEREAHAGSVEKLRQLRTLMKELAP